MRRALVPLVALSLAACVADEGVTTTTGSQPPLAPTTTVSGTTTVTTTPETTSTEAPATTSTTMALDDTVLSYEVVAEMDFPVQMTARPGDQLSYIITKGGRVWAFDGATVGEEPVLDISDQVANEAERGLLSIALHPSDPARIYLHYSDGNGDTVVSEFALASPTSADPSSERVLLQVDQPAPNHNGGMLQFLPGGELLLGLGDGGGADDRYGNGQNPETLLAGLVTIGVDGDPGPAKYALGLRNPWRFWIDGTRIYIADVGQNAYEEISVTEPLAPGLNYGWPLFEGLHCYRSADCDETGLVPPILEVEHGDAGTCSITGGIVYRGRAMPQLSGHYFFSDYCGGYLRSLLFADGAATDIRDWTEQVGGAGQVTGFGIDGAGEMYVTTTGEVLKVSAGG
jgi:glucose/arabinose dehydrogenase